MPRKKMKGAIIKKQNKQIASRLMQISLKVDDYVYNNIPIPKSSAEMFIKEVSSYQDKCYGDRPSLQVIEKLIRCMKGIIAEQQERQGRGANSSVTFVDVQSILTSSVDEDLKQMTPKIDSSKIFELPNNDVYDISVIGQGIIGFNKNDNGNNNITNGENFNKNLQKAISNLTIADDPLSTIGSDHGVCSQSILDNFEDFNNDCSVGTHANTQHFEGDKQSVVLRKRKNPSPIKIFPSSPTLHIPEKVQKENSSFPVKTTESSKISEPSVQGKRKLNNNNVNEKARRRRGTNKTKPRNDETKQTTAVKRNRQNKTVIEKKDIKTKPLENISTLGNFENVQHVPVSTREIDNNYQPKSCAKMQVYSSSTVAASSNKDIYNKNVENDLSWIENIRYVREVTQEENIPAFIDDNFWNDYTLPSDWNDDDFDY